MKKLVILLSFAGTLLLGGNAFACPCHDNAKAPEQPAAEEAAPAQDQAAPACACGADCKCGCHDGKACECHKDGKSCDCKAEGGCGCGK